MILLYVRWQTLLLCKQNNSPLKRVVSGFKFHFNYGSGFLVISITSYVDVLSFLPHLFPTLLWLFTIFFFSKIDFNTLTIAYLHKPVSVKTSYLFIYGFCCCCGSASLNVNFMVENVKNQILHLYLFIWLICCSTSIPSKSIWYAMVVLLLFYPSKIFEVFQLCMDAIRLFVWKIWREIYQVMSNAEIFIFVLRMVEAYGSIPRKGRWVVTGGWCGYG